MEQLTIDNESGAQLCWPCVIHSVDMPNGEDLGMLMSSVFLLVFTGRGGKGTGVEVGGFFKWGS